jgi:hypothetical protein
MATFSNNFVANSGKNGISKYFCEKCNYECCKKYNWEKHLLTRKHIKSTEINILATEKWQKVAIYCCDNCGKQYNDRSGLWRHNKICVYNNTENKKLSDLDKDELIITLLKQNAELIKGQQDMLIKLTENGINNTNNSHNTTNSNNKAFNLNLFLNETCKNAMNITDFVDSIKLQLSDFINVGEVGFIEGISNIIVKNLNSLDETVRPIHCTDQKRETFYVKDENKWEKEEEDNKKLKKMIRGVAFKNEKLMKTYKETYPDYNDPDSKRSDQYSKTVIEALDCKEESKDKIIRNISKATIIKTKI